MPNLADLYHTPDRTLVSLIDFTSLSETDSDTSIKALCEQAHTPLGDVAAVCVYPKFVPLCCTLLDDPAIKIATVCNFPNGTDALSTVTDTIKTAAENGADEIDVVFPYPALLAGDIKTVSQQLQSYRHACQKLTLKVILETGALTLDQIRQATTMTCNAGADFVKTSTGKTSIGATVEAADCMLKILNAFPQVGIKISGGVRTTEDAKTFLGCIAQYKKPEWMTPEHVRFGASQLLTNILRSQTG